MKVGYRKIVSFNPDKYEIISPNTAFAGYKEYIEYFSEAYPEDLDLMKSFQQWLDTEI